jgi:uncharacterized protein (TIGR01615 family)
MADVLERKLHSDLTVLSTASMTTSGNPLPLHTLEGLAVELLSLGYLTQVRVSKDGDHSKLKHKFIVCVGFHDVHKEEPTKVATPILVEPKFREHFLVANTTQSYESLLQALPTIFVGTADRLEMVVSVLAHEMRLAFESQGRTLPPWRTKEAMMSKWAPSELAQLERALQAAQPNEDDDVFSSLDSNSLGACCEDVDFRFMNADSKVTVNINYPDIHKTSTTPVATMTVKSQPFNVITTPVVASDGMHPYTKYIKASATSLLAAALKRKPSNATEEPKLLKAMSQDDSWANTSLAALCDGPHPRLMHLWG